jgi:hypothetical protein
MDHMHICWHLRNALLVVQEQYLHAGLRTAFLPAALAKSFQLLSTGFVGHLQGQGQYRIEIFVFNSCTAWIKDFFLKAVFLKAVQALQSALAKDFLARVNGLPWLFQPESVNTCKSQASSICWLTAMAVALMNLLANKVSQGGPKNLRDGGQDHVTSHD